MLSLDLKSGEYLTIGENVAVQIFQQSGASFRVAVQAPREVAIMRGEVYERSGGKRPAGLMSRRPKAPCEQVRNAKRLEQLARRKEQSQQKQRAQEEVAHGLREILDQVEGLGIEGSVREKVEALRARLASLSEEPAAN